MVIAGRMRDQGAGTAGRGAEGGAEATKMRSYATAACENAEGVKAAKMRPDARTGGREGVQECGERAKLRKGDHMREQRHVRMLRESKSCQNARAGGRGGVREC